MVFYGEYLVYFRFKKFPVCRTISSVLLKISSFFQMNVPKIKTQHFTTLTLKFFFLPLLMETFKNINIILTIFFSWCLETHADPLFTLLQIKLLALSRDRARVFQATDSELLGGTYSLKRILSVHLLSFLSLAFILWRLKKDCVPSYTHYITRRLTMCLVLCRVFTCIVSFNPLSTNLRWVMLLSSVYN